MTINCIGLMSGTSVDGIDAALIEISSPEAELKVNLVAGATYPYPAPLREKILAVCGGAALSMAELAQLDGEIATQFALAARHLAACHPPPQLLGSHGQTVFHRPPLAGEQEVKRQGDKETIMPLQLGYSLQLGRGELIAHLTGLPTVSNFRAADIAAGGQGAPLVAKVDAYLLAHPARVRCIQNLGGIGNVTYLPPRQTVNWEGQVRGWDTGPGNVLVDLAVQKLSGGQQTYDRDGSWASQGQPCTALVNQWLQQDFFQSPPPKSTGRELFGPEYLACCWQDAHSWQLSAADWLATLTELTAASIAHSYRNFLPQMPAEVLLCGGGSHNSYLRERLQVQLGSQTKLLTTAEVGLNGDFKEAIAFAILAYWRFYLAFPGNLPAVTGARQPVLLGDIHQPFF